MAVSMNTRIGAGLITTGELACYYSEEKQSSVNPNPRVPVGTRFILLDWKVSPFRKESRNFLVDTPGGKSWWSNDTIYFSNVRDDDGHQS